MKKKKFCIIGLTGLFLVTFFFGCEAPSYSYGTVNTNVSDVTKQTRDVVVSVPLIVEYDTIFNHLIVDTSTFQYSSHDGNLNIDYDNLKRMAAARCCRRNQCDILVNPVYEITYVDDGGVLGVEIKGKVTIIVSGLPAKYKTIRQATPNDLWILRFSGQ